MPDEKYLTYVNIRQISKRQIRVKGLGAHSGDAAIIYFPQDVAFSLMTENKMENVSKLS